MSHVALIFVCFEDDDDDDDVRVSIGSCISKGEYTSDD